MLAVAVEEPCAVSEPLAKEIAGNATPAVGDVTVIEPVVSVEPAVVVATVEPAKALIESTMAWIVTGFAMVAFAMVWLAPP